MVAMMADVLMLDYGTGGAPDVDDESDREQTNGDGRMGKA